MKKILYKGAVPQLTDVMGGHVSAAVSPMPGVSPFLKSGKLRPIAVTSSKRIAQWPDVPTVAESGLPGFELLSWYGMWGPANLPREIAERLATEIGKAVKAPALQVRFNDLSFETVETTPAQFAKVVHDEIIKVGKVVKAANISIEP